MNGENEKFTYTYSAREQEEIRNIRDKYSAPSAGETPIEQLRRLDKSAVRGAAVFSTVIGIIGSLLLGVGLCCTMVEGWEMFFIPGIVVGVIGLGLTAAAYPIYKKMSEQKRKKLAPEIIRLSDELLK